MNTNILLSSYFSTPPVTRFLSLSILFLMTLVYIKLIPPYTLMYSPLFLRYFEFWRIITCFLYFGKPSLDVIIHISFLYRYSKSLEEGFIYTSDYMYLIIIVFSMLFGIANILNLSNLASAFSATITYIWTRKNPHALVQMFGFITFPAFYLPFIVPGFMLITEKRILVEDLLGILVGHVYFFLKEVYPKYGVDVLKTPCLIKKLCNEHQSGCCKNKRGKVLKMRGNSGVKLDGVKNSVVSKLDGVKNSINDDINSDDDIKIDGFKDVDINNSTKEDIINNVNNVNNSLNKYDVFSSTESDSITDKEDDSEIIVDKKDILLDTNKLNDKSVKDDNLLDGEENNIINGEENEEENKSLNGEENEEENKKENNLVNKKENNLNNEEKDECFEEGWSSQTLTESEE